MVAVCTGRRQTHDTAPCRGCRRALGWLKRLCRAPASPATTSTTLACATPASLVRSCGGCLATDQALGFESGRRGPPFAAFAAVPGPDGVPVPTCRVAARSALTRRKVRISLVPRVALSHLFPLHCIARCVAQIAANATTEACGRIRSCTARGQRAKGPATGACSRRERSQQPLARSDDFVQFESTLCIAKP